MKGSYAGSVGDLSPSGCEGSIVGGFEVLVRNEKVTLKVGRREIRFRRRSVLLN